MWRTSRGACARTGAGPYRCRREDVILNASLEVRGAVVYATFAVILVFLPVVMLPGLAGRFFAPLGLAYVLAILASLVVALAVTPALCMLLAPQDPEAEGAARASDDPPVTRWLRKGYERMLRGIVARPRTTIAGALAFTVVGFGGAAVLRRRLPAGTARGPLHPAHGGRARHLDRGVAAHRQRSSPTRCWSCRSCASWSQRIGRARRPRTPGARTTASSRSTSKRDLSGAESDQAQAAMRKVLADLSGRELRVEDIPRRAGGGDRCRATPRPSSSTSTATISMRSTGGARGRPQLSEVQGATEVQLQSPPGMPQLTIRQRKADLERWGLDSVDVLDMLRAAYQGDIVGQSYEGNRVFNVITMLDEESRNSVSKVADLPLRTPAGTFVALHQVADVYQAAGRYQVLHLGGQRVQAVDRQRHRPRCRLLREAGARGDGAR